MSETAERQATYDDLLDARQGMIVEILGGTMVRPTHKRRADRVGAGVRTAIFCMLIAFAIPASALQVEARLDASVIRLGQSVRLLLEMDGKPADPPNLGVLEHDFRIVGRHRSSSRSSVNGRITERNRLVLTLLPLQTGVLEIPPIRFADTATAPLRLTVTEATAEPPFASTPSGGPEAAPATIPTQALAPLPAVQPAFDSDTAMDAPVLLEVSIEPTRVRVAQQAVLIVRVLMPKSVTVPVLHEPNAGNASLLFLGEDWDQVTRGDTGYGVYERRYAVFPRQSGRLEIDALVFEAWVSKDGHRPQPLRVSSEPLNLQVLPAADTPSDASWLPARDLRLVETAPETYRIRVGQTLERVIDLRADGIAAADLPAPELSMPHQLEVQRSLDGLWDERTPEGVIGTRRERIRLTAREPGRYSLPEAKLGWWDTSSGSWKTAGLSARELIVLAATADAPRTPPLFEPVETRDTWTQASSAEPPQNERSSSTPPATQRSGTSESNVWLWISLCLAAAWLLVIAARIGSRRRAGTADSAERRPDPHRAVTPEDPLAEAIDQVRCAYESGEAGAAREALLAWAAIALPEQPPGNLALLAKRCHEPLHGEILLLEQAFFSPRPLHWERRRVWERLPGFEPVPLPEPASFRRKKPLRRHKPAPDTTS